MSRDFSLNILQQIGFYKLQIISIYMGQYFAPEDYGEYLSAGADEDFNDMRYYSFAQKALLMAAYKGLLLTGILHSDDDPAADPLAFARAEIITAEPNDPWHVGYHIDKATKESSMMMPGAGFYIRAILHLIGYQITSFMSEVPTYKKMVENGDLDGEIAEYIQEIIEDPERVIMIITPRKDYEPIITLDDILCSLEEVAFPGEYELVGTHCVIQRNTKANVWNTDSDLDVYFGLPNAVTLLYDYLEMQKRRARLQIASKN